MADIEIIEKINQLTLNHEDKEDRNSDDLHKESRIECGWLEEGVTCLKCGDQQNGIYSDISAGNLQSVELSQNVTSEKRDLDESHKDKDHSVFKTVKRFINDFFAHIVGRQYFRRTNVTGLIYDEKMTEYHAAGCHPECPERITSMYGKLCDKGLVRQCTLVKPRSATTDELLSKHSMKHITFIDSIKGRQVEELRTLDIQFDSIYFHHGVTEAAFLAAGCTLALMEEVIVGNLLNGAAIIRPPGHHALTHCSMGFCHFNNVAVAAQVAIEKYKLNRILIVDWDVHYGNGTHKMFEDDPRVLFFSMHRYDHGSFWPNDKQANFDAVGLGKGEGFNIHVAWNEEMMGDAEYLLAFEKILVPIAAEYNPELILVSCGFDSGSGDPLGCCNVTPAGYAHMTRKLMDFASGKLVLVLEGGYNLDTISNSMAACVSALLNHSLPSLSLEDLNPVGVQSVTDTFHVMQKYWHSLSNEKADVS